MREKIIIWIALGVITLGVLMLSSKLSYQYDTKIDVILDEGIEKSELKIMINPHGNLLDGYEPTSFLGRNYKYYLLYENGVIQNYNLKDINKYSDYYIYAKYKNKYAKMKYTNSLVLGDNETFIQINVKKIEDTIYLSSTKKPSSTIDAISENSFKDIQAFEEDKYDARLLGYLSQL